jgi:hypothetical protein
MTDVSKTPIGSGAIPPENCGCTLITAPCCKSHYCVPGALCNGMRTFIDAGPEPELDAQSDSDGDIWARGGLPCSLLTGPLDSGTYEAGPTITWCLPSQDCIPVNGVWNCCTVTKRTTLCVTPLSRDGG